MGPTNVLVTVGDPLCAEQEIRTTFTGLLREDQVTALYEVPEVIPVWLIGTIGFDQMFKSWNC